MKRGSSGIIRKLMEGKMTGLLDIVGNVLAISGVVLCVVAGGARALGYFYFFGFESMTLFTVGIAVMVMACLLKMQSLIEKA